MTQPSGVHHLAISTSDIKGQIEFFTQVMGAELVALYWMHGLDAWHAFVRLNDTCLLAFVDMPANHKIDALPGVTHSGTAGDPSAPGTMQHVAFRSDTFADLLKMRDRIRSHGINVLGPIDHGMCHSIYFGGPEGMVLEMACSTEPIPADLWIDPEVVALAGISEDELALYRDPPADPGGAPGSMPQPPIDAAKPRLAYSDELWEAVVAMSDDDLSASMNYPDPPVVVAARGERA